MCHYLGKSRLLHLQDVAKLLALQLTVHSNTEQKIFTQNRVRGVPISVGSTGHL